VKVVTILGARPQFIKAAAVSRAIRRRAAEAAWQEVIVHTGQHFDANMSDVFFTELDIPQPDHLLGISGLGHGAMTGRMLERIDTLLQQERPDWVLIYGDTNSTLAGALAAAKLHIPVAHVEAGLRSFNMRMPEEVNRILADRVSALLLCPTTVAVDNLRAEGVTQGVHNVGDVMFDVSLFYRERARRESDALTRLGVETGPFALATVHRAENTDDPARLHSIVSALGHIATRMKVVLPLHPRTRKLLETYGLTGAIGDAIVTDPLPYLDMVALEQAAATILTDSGGVQKEAFFYGVPCITMRDETEWVETVACGANRVVGASTSAILEAFESVMAGARVPEHVRPYGDGTAADQIVTLLQR
jgi:UDP-GlcNAc3NAcA epimerase